MRYCSGLVHDHGLSGGMRMRILSLTIKKGPLHDRGWSEGRHGCRVTVLSRNDGADDEYEEKPGCLKQICLIS